MCRWVSPLALICRLGKPLNENGKWLDFVFNFDKMYYKILCTIVSAQCFAVVVVVVVVLPNFCDLLSDHVYHLKILIVHSSITAHLYLDLQNIEICFALTSKALRYFQKQ